VVFRSSPASLDTANMRLRDAVPLRNDRLNLCRRAYFSALFVCQRGIRVVFAMRHSVLRSRIFDVVCNRTELEMVRVHALTVVAGVHDQLPTRDRSFVDFVRVSVGSVFVTRGAMKKTVSGGREISGPFPTPTRDDFVFDSERIARGENRVLTERPVLSKTVVMCFA